MSDLSRAPPRIDAAAVKGPVHGLALLPKVLSYTWARDASSIDPHDCK
jgi:hypothetical protein